MTLSMATIFSGGLCRSQPEVPTLLGRSGEHPNLRSMHVMSRVEQQPGYRFQDIQQVLPPPKCGPERVW